MTERQQEALNAIKKDIEDEDTCDGHLPMRVGPAKMILHRILEALTMEDKVDEDCSTAP